MLPTPSRRQSGTDYPSCGVSENTTKGCDVVSPHGEEKELEASTVNKECPVPVTPLIPKDEYPDGGLRAWLVVFGVGCSSSRSFNGYKLQVLTRSVHRRRVVLSQRMRLYWRTVC